MLFVRNGLLHVIITNSIWFETNFQVDVHLARTKQSIVRYVDSFLVFYAIIRTDLGFKMFLGTFKKKTHTLIEPSCVSMDTDVKEYGSDLFVIFFNCSVIKGFQLG